MAMTYLMILVGVVVLAGITSVVLKAWRELLLTRLRIRLEEEEARIRAEQVKAGLEQQRSASSRQTISSRGARFREPASEDKEIDVPQPKPPPELIRALTAGESVLFAGPGLVSPGGVPSLDGLLQTIIDRLQSELPNEDWDPIEEALLGEEASAAIAQARASLGEERFEKILREEIAFRWQTHDSSLDSLTEIPFSGALTVDWSSLTRAKIFPFGGPANTPLFVDEAIDSFRDGEFFFLEAAGSIWRPPLHIGFDDMRNLALVDRDYARFVVSLLSTRSILFLGSDITGVEEFLDCFPTPRDKREHWALVPWERRVELDRDRFRRRYQVNLLPYAPSVGHQEATRQFVRGLQEGLPSQRRGRRVPPEAEQLRELRLQNIGPFDQLHLELDRPTVLLGDNGSGKSSVLRAIALALTGDSADESVARRMLKTTATRGEIELVTDRGHYRTRLAGDSQRVRIETDGLPPIQASGWLALGFPPLRGVSLDNPRGPTAALADEPVPEDLLPLLSNGPDKRLDGLKQWVVNTEMQADDPSHKTGREKELLERFFLILKELTPGAKFEYMGVDRKGWEVKLDSPDGPVSFDLLSRGMTAVMGWVGILLQRLYEVHGDRDGRPEEQRALVLVDEIDVHLHPEWQHLVLPMIGEHFPNIQLIVTTHSPLIVGNAASGVVQLLRRVDDVLVSQRLSNEFSGWRSDQILTSAAFGLESTRDAVTAAKHREYRELMARGETPEVSDRARQLFTELEERMPAEQETAAEREGAALFRTWLKEYFASRPSPEQDKIISEAELYLDRLYAERSK